jgi:hypothetical protein
MLYIKVMYTLLDYYVMGCEVKNLKKELGDFKYIIVHIVCM